MASSLLRLRVPPAALLVPFGVAVAFMIFLVYCWLRAESEWVGFHPGLFFFSLVPAGMSATFVMGMLCFTRFGATRPRTGWCHDCGYSLSRLPRDLCPECGWEPPPFSPGRRAAPLWVGILLAALVVAAPVAAETYVCADEAAFRREAASRPGGGGRKGGPPYMRSRWWPSGHSALVYDRGRIINTG